MKNQGKKVIEKILLAGIILTATFIMQGCGKDENEPTPQEQNDGDTNDDDGNNNSGDDDTNAINITVNGFEIDTLENIEDNTAFGTVEGSASDNSTVSFAISSQSVNGAMVVDAGTGVVSVADKAAFDFETNTTLSAEVTVSSGGVSEMATVTVNLLDDVLEADNGLIANYLFNGDLTSDINPADYNATWFGTNPTDYVTDRHGNASGAINYDPSDFGNDGVAYVEDALGGQQSFSVSAWIKTNPSYSDYRTIASLTLDGASGAAEMFEMYIARDGNKSWETGAFSMEFFNDGTNKIVSSTRPIPSDEWIHVVFTMDGTTGTATTGTGKLYENGVEKAVDANMSFDFTSGGTFAIGGKAWFEEFEGLTGPGGPTEVRDGAMTFKGQIDDTALFNTALSSDEVLQLYNTTKPE